MRRYSTWAGGALILTMALSLGANQAGADGAEDPAGHAFVRAVERYMTLRDHAIRDLPALESSHDAEKIHAAIEARGAAIAAARPHAAPGDLFTADVQQSFRQRIRVALAEDGYSETEAFRIIYHGSDRLPVLTVNGLFPWSFGSVMLPCVLAALPSLPAGLEYRFVHTALVLVDVDASLVVDILPDVLIEERYALRAQTALDAPSEFVSSADR